MSQCFLKKDDENLELKIENIGKLFQRSCFALLTKNFCLVPFDKNETKRFVNRVNKTLDSIIPEYCSILNNTYFKNSYSYWWIDEYSKSSFYRNKRKSIKAFFIAYNSVV